MKLIKIKEENGVRYINPAYVRTIHGFHSEYSDEWCITLDMMTSVHDSLMDSIYTLLLHSQEEYEKKMYEILDIIGQA